MKYRVIAAGFLAATVAVPMLAQCPTPAADACQKAADLLNYMTPQLSTSLVGGNATLGQGGTLGGFGHFSIDLRGGLLNGSLPQLDNVPLHTDGVHSDPFTTKNQIIPSVSLDAGIGLWRGMSLGITHVGGIDAIVTMTYLPSLKSSGTSSSGDFTVNGSNEKFGYGLRVGLLEESITTPGVSFTWAERDLPVVSFTGTVQASGTNPSGSLALNDFAVKTSAWRLTAGKSFMIFGLSAGYGQDKYNSTSTIMATVDGPFGGTGSVPGKFAMTRSNYFLGLSINVVVFKIEGEYGAVSGGADPTTNTFAPAANKSRSYFTLGLRFGR
ncbi:MAG: hypothetical protein ACREN6_14310 [Gemmatimonadaceae bacterium]